MSIASSRNSTTKHPGSQRESRLSRAESELQKHGPFESGDLRSSTSGMRQKHDDAARQSCSPGLIGAGLEALDSVDVGVVVADELGKLVLANHVAEQILEARDGIELTSRGTIVIATESGFRPVGSSRGKRSQSDSRNNHGMGDGVNVVPRGLAKRPLTVLVRPLNAGGVLRNPTEPAFLIFLLDPERPTQATEDGLRELYEFTASEARLAHLLMSGKTFDECCTQLGVRASTIRMHLANLFAKTGVRRQGQLISLLLRSVGMVRTSPEPNRRRKRTVSRAPHESNRHELDVAVALSASLEALNWLDLGILVLNRLGEILFTNQRATKILAAKDGLEVTPQRTLSTCQKRWLPSRGSFSRTFSPMDAVVAVQRPNGKRPLTLIMRSLQDQEQCSAGSPAALVFVLDPELAAEATEARLQALYGFTLSESRLGRLLMEGRTIDECCEPLSICASTARRHLANIFSKTDVRHQGQLISLLLKSAGTVRVKNDECLNPSPPAAARKTAILFSSASLPYGVRP